DDLIAELAVLEDLVRDEPAQLAGSRDENPLQPDPRAPAPLERFPYELARRVRQRDVQDQEEAPDDLRDLEDPFGLRRAAREIRLHVQRGDDAEDDGEDAADEDGEEVVHARSPAPQPV